MTYMSNATKYNKIMSEIISVDYQERSGTYFVTKIVLSYCNCEKKLFYWLGKTFENWGWFFEITITIYSKSERSEQFLWQSAFSTCSWRFLRSNILEQIVLRWEKLLGFRNLQKNLGNSFSVSLRLFLWSRWN